MVLASCLPFSVFNTTKGIQLFWKWTFTYLWVSHVRKWVCSCTDHIKCWPQGNITILRKLAICRLRMGACPSIFFVFSRKPLLPLQNKTKKGNYIMIQLLAFFTQRNTNDSPALKSFKQKMQTISNSVSPSFNVDNWKKNLSIFLFYFGTILVLKSRDSRIYPSQILVWLYLAVVDIWALKLYYYKSVLFLVLVKSFHSSKEY